MPKLPYIQFFTDDWLSDEKLRLCSLSARGLWTDMLCLMHKCDRRGYLQQASGKPFTLEQIARIAGSSTEEVSRLLQELTDSGAASLTEHGIVYNRRMVRDEQIREARAASGRKGGEATAVLLKQNGQQNDSKPRSKHMDYGDGFGIVVSEGIEGCGEKGKPPDDFVRFWEAYPRKVGKGAALKAWNAARRKETAEVIISAVQEYAASPVARTDFVKHPTTWLNGECWADDRAAWQRSERNGKLSQEEFDRRVLGKV